MILCILKKKAKIMYIYVDIRVYVHMDIKGVKWGRKWHGEDGIKKETRSLLYRQQQGLDFSRPRMYFLP